MTRFVLFAGAALLAPGFGAAQESQAPQSATVARADEPCAEALPAALWSGGEVAADDEVRAELERAGFTEVEVVSQAYMVATTAPNGGCALSLVWPRQFGEVGAARDAVGDAAGAENGAPADESDRRRRAEAMGQELAGAGHRDARVVDAAYVVRATSPGGESVTMIVNGSQVEPAVE